MVKSVLSKKGLFVWFPLYVSMGSTYVRAYAIYCLNCVSWFTSRQGMRGSVTASNVVESGQTFYIRTFFGFGIWGAMCFDLHAASSFSSALKIAAVCTSETSLNFGRTTQHYIPQNTSILRCLSRLAKSKYVSDTRHHSKFSARMFGVLTVWSF
jgi:hypothetical protein